MIGNKQCIICKDEDGTDYEVWEKDEKGLFNFIDTFKDIDEALSFCESNNYEVQTSYGVKQFK